MGRSSFNPFELPAQSALSEQTANAVYDLLVKYKMQPNNDRSRDMFVKTQTNPSHICTEYNLNCANGHKFWNVNRKFYVDTVSGHKTPEIEGLNKELEAIYLKHTTEVAESMGLI